MRTVNVCSVNVCRVAPYRSISSFVLRVQYLQRAGSRPTRLSHHTISSVVGTPGEAWRTRAPAGESPRHAFPRDAPPRGVLRWGGISPLISRSRRSNSSAWSAIFGKGMACSSGEAGRGAAAPCGDLELGEAGEAPVTAVWARAAGTIDRERTRMSTTNRPQRSATVERRRQMTSAAQQ
jgi:hypothetical protein